jgi:hypothetical protein
VALPVPNPRTAVAGEFETAAFMNMFRDAINFLANKPLAVIYQGTAQSFTSSSGAAVTFDQTTADTYSGHSNSTNNTRYTAVVAGWYWIVGTVTWANVSGGNRNVSINKNGTGVPQFGTADPSASALVFPAGQVTALVQLNVGDYVEVIAYQDSGGAVSTHANGSSMAVIWDHA